VQLDRYLATRRRLVEQALARALPSGRSQLRKAMRYSLLAGGKRLRPILALAAGDVAGGTLARVMPFACALEFIHTYSLVHDDLPAMDDDDLRRGRPTSHKVWGEGVAILVGDALLTEAFGLMAAARGVEPSRALAAIRELSSAAGELGMVGGQALDLAGEGGGATLAQVRAIHARKTGKLFTASLRVGALVGGASAPLLRRLTTYGEQLGLAFQIADDILDEAGGPGGDGRTDQALGKATYPGVLGTDGARAHLVRARDAALHAVAPLGPVAAPLRDIAVYVAAQVETPAHLAASA
jgi:geranylgeranyl diphosphate synthase, type II